MSLELFGMWSCPFTTELRESLDWAGRDFDEHDVENDPAALARLRELCPGATAVPVLVEDGRVVQVGVNGRSCYVAHV